jgi:hypothetical protein
LPVEAGFFAAGFAVAGFAVCDTADVSFFSSFASSVCSSGKGCVISWPAASLISDTFLINAMILSYFSSVTTIMLKSKSNFSSSISCTDGSDLMISPCPSRFLNTRNALAAFKIQFSSTLTLILYT